MAGGGGPYKRLLGKVEQEKKKRGSRDTLDMKIIKTIARTGTSQFEFWK